MTRTSFSISDYDKFVSFCTLEFKRNPRDQALHYFDNRFYNRRVDNQTGHLRQAFYAAKEFFSRFPEAKRISRDLLANGRLRTEDWPHLEKWISFVRNHGKITLPEGGDMGTVHKILPVTLGGIVTGGGGAGPSFKVVIPLVSKYLEQRGATQRDLTPVGADTWDDLADDTGRSTRRRRFMTSRIIRDSEKSLEMKLLYDHRCQVCLRRIEVRRGDFYAETHHLQPLGGRHLGPDIRANMLILCPWHHAEFDHFLYFIGSRHTLRHRLRKLTPAEPKLILRSGHRVGSEFIDYNNTYYRKLAAE
ncbi:MAG: HNH endonuclease [Terriglobia bacterium]